MILLSAPFCLRFCCLSVFGVSSVPVILQHLSLPASCFNWKREKNLGVCEGGKSAVYVRWRGCVRACMCLWGCKCVFVCALRVISRERERERERESECVWEREREREREQRISFNLPLPAFLSVMRARVRVTLTSVFIQWCSRWLPDYLPKITMRMTSAMRQTALLYR